MLTAKFLRFLLAGGTAAPANYESRFIFSRFFDFWPAIFLAYLVGMLMAFLLMRGHVFDAKSKALIPQVLQFVGVNVLAVVQTLIISMLLARGHFRLLEFSIMQKLRPTCLAFWCLS